MALVGQLAYLDRLQWFNESLLRSEWTVDAMSVAKWLVELRERHNEILEAINNLKTDLKCLGHETQQLYAKLS
jgi:hypothetical protein